MKKVTAQRYQKADVKLNAGEVAALVDAHRRALNTELRGILEATGNVTYVFAQSRHKVRMEMVRLAELLDTYLVQVHGDEVLEVPNGGGVVIEREKSTTPDADAQVGS